MKVPAMLKKNAMYIVIAILVALFVYYVYMNKYSEHATNQTDRVCALFTNTTANNTVTLNIYAVDSTYAAVPTYTAKKVLSTTVAKNESKPLKFKTGNYGFIVDVASRAGSTTYNLTNLSLQKKRTRKDMWGRKRTSYQCDRTVVKTTLAASSPEAPAELPIIDTDGNTLIKGNATKTPRYSLLYTNSANDI